MVVDGNRLPQWEYASEAVVKGDGRVEVISAASIIAKVVRDAEMLPWIVTTQAMVLLQIKAMEHLSISRHYNAWGRQRFIAVHLHRLATSLRWSKSRYFKASVF